MDLGCGSGKYSKLCSNFFDDVYGVDISENMVYEAIKKGIHNSHFLQCSGERLPFKNNFFDMIISVNVLHIMNQKDKIFKEVKRIGKENCVFLVIDNIDGESNQKDISNILKTFLRDVKNNYKSPRFLREKTFFFVKLLKHEFHHRTYKDRGEFERTMQKCGDCKIKYTKKDGILFGIAKIRFR